MIPAISFILGYKHYPDDVVRKFVEYSIKNGIDIIRIFDALNDARNLEVAIDEAVGHFGTNLPQPLPGVLLKIA